jgi:mannose-1-phosphate guanylyltransferase
MLKNGAQLFGFLSSGIFLDFGTPSDYLRGTLAVLDEITRGATQPVGAQGAAITPPVYISRRARIAPGAMIGPGAVIEDDASVGEGAAVSRAILWPGAALPAGHELAGAILTPRRRVEVP